MKNTLKKIEKLYSQNLENHGQNSKAVGWNTPECQKLRFKKLSEVFKEDNLKKKTSLSINDYGCGYGALIDYLISENINIESYNGYDISEDMTNKLISKYHKIFKNNSLKVFNNEYLSTIADYSVVSGTFNLKFSESEKKWEKFVQNKLLEINAHSSKGFSFNLLSTYVDWQEDHLFYGNPNFWFDYCKQKFSKKVSLLHDYPLFEFTIIVKK